MMMNEQKKSADKPHITPKNCSKSSGAGRRALKEICDEGGKKVGSVA
jgi:hypothetical protein